MKARTMTKAVTMKAASMKAASMKKKMVLILKN
jgi:hypothetical protein